MSFGLRDKIFKDEFLKNNLIFFVGSMIIAVLNYLYHPILSRLMSVQDFGEVQTLMALFLQFAILFRVFSVITINISANGESKEEKSAIISELREIAIYIVGGMFLLIIIFSKNLQGFFQFDSFYPFISLAVLLVLGVFLSFRNAILQGYNDFKSASIAGIIGSFFRLFFAVLLVIIGWRAFGAITGLVLSQLLGLGYMYLKTKDKIDFKQKLPVHLKKEKIKRELKYGGLVFLVAVVSILLYTADILFVKHYFSPTDAGFYSGIATIARIVIFISGSVSAVLLPSIKLKNNANENRNILKKASMIILIVSGFTLLIFSLFPNLVIKIFIGSKFMEFAYLLPRIGLVAFCVSLITLFSNYFLALRDFSLAIIAGIGITLIFGLSLLNHATLMAVVNNFLISSIVILAMLVCKLVKSNSSSVT